MSKVLIDGLIIRKELGGIKVYLQKVLEYLPQEKKPNFILITSNDNKHLFSRFDIEKFNIPISATNPIVRIFLQQIIVPLIVLFKRIDVLYQPVDIISLLAPCKQLTCIHSNHINSILGEYGKIKKTYVLTFFKWTIKRAHRIITISDYVKDETIRIFGFGEEKMKTIYHGGGLVEDHQNWAGTISENHFLFTGTLFNHKNVDKLIDAYALALDKQPSLPELHIVGADFEGNLNKYKHRVEDLGCSKNVVFFGRINDDELLEQIFTALAIVYPSSIEGFGLPLVEAMHARKPLICSNETSIPEVAGDAAIITNVYDRDIFSNDLIRLFDDKSLRAELIEKSIERGKKFNWNNTVRETIKEIEKLSK
ncbi:Glycosyltransferase involved in cell wall bisynthesis [Ekhidna lutea]|uniref:Glycosyltransferase involved in cell wall bisynthesis n=1 Tax=Ekhidna lutea TaxID=447679 RepID=A0A239FHP8_EKHLU|nr:glycosyltransferase family 1 protein [Ekhidna lutea]SNS55823.1 Glycosyltransferase involved in cell wall bisynthesis [Ekhidna lutea]